MYWLLCVEQEMTSLLDNIAKATIEVFQQHTIVKQEPGASASLNMGRR
jgi:hypothetical protein